MENKGPGREGEKGKEGKDLPGRRPGSFAAAARSARCQGGVVARRGRPLAHRPEELLLAGQQAKRGLG